MSLNKNILSSEVEGVANIKNDNINLVSMSSLKWQTFLPQIFACCIAHSVVINCGISLVFSAILLPQLMVPNSELPISKSDASWIASVVTISAPIGALITGVVMDKIGRRSGCKVSAILISASWILMYISHNVAMLCFSRFLCGIATGLTTVVLVYVSEISHPQVRPALLCLNSVFFSLGILLACMSGVWLTWRATALWSAMMSAVTFVLMWFLPESPYWLAIHCGGNEDSNYWEEAEASLQWLYRNEIVLMQEMENLKQNLQDTRKMKTFSLIEYIRSFRNKSSLKPFILLLGLFVFQQCSGGYVLIFYAVHLFRKIGGEFGSVIDELQVLVLMGAIRFIMSLLISVLSHKIGRRHLLMTSYIGMCLTALVIALYVYFYIPEANDDLFVNNVSEGHWIPIVCILLFVCSSGIGVLILPWTLVVELLPVQVRGVAGGFMISWAYFLMFIAVKNFPSILYILGISNVFFCLSAVCIAAYVYTFLFLPETLGKSFTEIENAFM